MSTALVWFRRDLRLADHPALRAALDRHERVLPVFIHAPEEEAPWAPGAASRWWLHHALAALTLSLEKCGAPLVIRRGESLRELRALAEAVGAEAVYWNRLYEPAIVARDRRVKSALREAGLVVESFNAALLFEPWEPKPGSGEAFKVFTPFWNKGAARLREDLARGRAPQPAPRRIASPSKFPASRPLASLELLPAISWDQGFYKTWTPGELGARAQLRRFADRALAHYRERRDAPALDATSRLSPHLHYGEISPLQVAVRIERLMDERRQAGVRRNGEWFLRELGWREFAHHLLFHFPQTSDAPLNPKFAAFPWRRPREYAPNLRAWQRGATGIPIVDAGMRQLWAMGRMHNRVRMIAASFLTKNLLVPWQDGARWFWDTLVDASLANNTLGWQWVAGCGADAAPYFRVFNPVLQSAKFDASGAYIRKWVAELAKLPDAAIHAPWDAAPEVLASAGILLDREYPRPVVNLAASRASALAAYGELRKS